QAVGQLGRLRRKARRIHDDAGVREFGQPLQLVDVVPGQVEVGGDLLHETGGGAAAVAMLQRAQIGAGDIEGDRHVFEAEAAGRPQLTHPAPERRHFSYSRRVLCQSSIDWSGYSANLRLLLPPGTATHGAFESTMICASSFGFGNGVSIAEACG